MVLLGKWPQVDAVISLLGLASATQAALAWQRLSNKSNCLSRSRAWGLVPVFVAAVGFSIFALLKLYVPDDTVVKWKIFCPVMDTWSFVGWATLQTSMVSHAYITWRSVAGHKTGLTAVALWHAVGWGVVVGAVLQLKDDDMLRGGSGACLQDGIRDGAVSLMAVVLLVGAVIVCIRNYFAISILTKSSEALDKSGSREQLAHAMIDRVSGAALLRVTVANGFWLVIWENGGQSNDTAYALSHVCLRLQVLLEACELYTVFTQAAKRLEAAGQCGTAKKTVAIRLRSSHAKSSIKSSPVPCNDNNGDPQSVGRRPPRSPPRALAPSSTASSTLTSSTGATDVTATTRPYRRSSSVFAPCAPSMVDDGVEETKGGTDSRGSGATSAAYRRCASEPGGSVLDGAAAAGGGGGGVAANLVQRKGDGGGSRKHGGGSRGSGSGGGRSQRRSKRSGSSTKMVLERDECMDDSTDSSSTRSSSGSPGRTHTSTPHARAQTRTRGKPGVSSPQPGMCMDDLWVLASNEQEALAFPIPAYVLCETAPEDEQIKTPTSSDPLLSLDDSDGIALSVSRWRREMDARSPPSQAPPSRAIAVADSTDEAGVDNRTSPTPSEEPSPVPKPAPRRHSDAILAMELGILGA